MSLGEKKVLARHALALWAKDSKESADQILNLDCLNHQYRHRYNTEEIFSLNPCKSAPPNFTRHFSISRAASNRKLQKATRLLPP